MTDMHAFERLVSEEVQVEAGPSRPTDVAAVIRSATTQSSRWRFRTMFSATKLVVAGAIVALFSGFLLAGLLPIGDTDTAPAAIATPLESPDGTVREDILPDYLRVDEVEPGVFRVDNDGYRTFAREVEQRDLSEMRDFFAMVSELSEDRIVAGLDGSLWVWTRDGRYSRLGDPETYDLTDVPGVEGFSDIEVAPDGRIWAVGTGTRVGVDGGLHSFDGERWTVQKRIEPSPENHRADGFVTAVEVGPDGQVWAAWINDKLRSRVARLDGDRWTTFASRGRDPLRDHLRFALGSEDDVWVLLDVDKVKAQPFRHFGNGFAPAGPPRRGAQIDVGHDKTAWLAGGPDGTLTRFDGNSWMTFDQAERPPRAGGHFQGPMRVFEVGSDGSIWYDPYDLDHVWGCNGIANFDGESVRHHLQDHCVYGGDVAPDGTAYVFAGLWDGTVDAEGSLSALGDAGTVNLFAIPPAQA